MVAHNPETHKKSEPKKALNGVVDWLIMDFSAKFRVDDPRLIKNARLWLSTKLFLC